MLAVVVTLEAVPGKAEALIAALEGNADHSREESSCLRWEWSRHVEAPDQFAIYELYVNAEAFAEHKKSDHFAAWKEATEGIIAWKRSGQYEVVGADPR